VDDQGDAQGETEEQEERKSQEETESGYLCDYSSKRLMTEADIKELNKGTYENLPQGKTIIQMVINEMYARYGYQFQSEEIQKYFEQKKWYQDIAVKNTDMNNILKNMTETEKKNVEFLSAYSGQ